MNTTATTDTKLECTAVVHAKAAAVDDDGRTRLTFELVSGEVVAGKPLLVAVADDPKLQGVWHVRKRDGSAVTVVREEVGHVAF